jgi:type VI secretion system protein VasD
MFMSKGLKIAMALGLLVAACVSPPPPPDPTVAQVTIVTTDDANPDPTGRASPAVVFVYALQPGAPFSTAPMDEMLGGQLTDDSMTRVARMVIVPGKTIKKIFTLPDGSTDVGIAVAYREIETAKWREQSAVTPNAVTLVKATVGTNEILVE